MKFCYSTNKNENYLRMMEMANKGVKVERERNEIKDSYYKNISKDRYIRSNF